MKSGTELCFEESEFSFGVHDLKLHRGKSFLRFITNNFVEFLKDTHELRSAFLLLFTFQCYGKFVEVIGFSQMIFFAVADIIGGKYASGERRRKIGDNASYKERETGEE